VSSKGEDKRVSGSAVIVTKTPFPFLFVAIAASCGDSPSAPDEEASAYDIEIRYVGTPTAAQQVAVSVAVARWESIIVGDVANQRVRIEPGACFSGNADLNEVVDDLVLYIDFGSIDGIGNALGKAGPCFVRAGSGLPVVGYLQLDAADVAQMERNGTFSSVLLHEIGHVLGFGTVWSRLGLLSGAGTSAPEFAGAGAATSYRSAGGTGSNVPVENTGGAGTRDSHWRESVFGAELMTGYVNSGSNPLSAVTIASLRDLGYEVRSTVAAPFMLNTPASVLQYETPTASDIVLMPTHEASPDGTLRPINPTRLH
jgi:hypothetical protein